MKTEKEYILQWLDANGNELQRKKITAYSKKEAKKQALIYYANCMDNDTKKVNVL